MTSSGTAPSVRGSLPCAISSAVRCTTRSTPISPTKRWCASSVSMNRVVRASGSKPLSASAESWYLPSRSVNIANMKKLSQSSIGSLNAFRMRGLSEEPLLLDRGGLGVGLRDDDAAERVAVLAGDLVPGGLAVVVAEADLPLASLRREEDAPAVFGHAHVVERRPPVRLHADGGAQVDLVRLESLGADLAPPGEEVRLPLLERALQAPVAREVDVVGDRFQRLCHYVLLQSKRGRSGLPYKLSAPVSPVALGRMKIQFCQAERRPKILVASVSGPGKR